MLKRLYVDNFRCLVNFELKFDPINLLLGDNGTGKSSIFDLLYRLQRFIGGQDKVDAAFPTSDLTRWQTLPEQRFELALVEGQNVYKYRLLIEHDLDRRSRRIKSEELWFDEKPLFVFHLGMVQLFLDDSKQWKYPFDWTQSGLSALPPRDDIKRLTGFRNQVSKWVVVGINPMAMNSDSASEDPHPTRRMENLAAWYRYLSQEYQGNVFEITQELRRVLPGFDSFSLKESGENVRTLKARFQSNGTTTNFLEYKFDELSDGQRVLAAIYFLLFGLKGAGYSLFIDEPDNFVALREVQPWLTALYDSAGDRIRQAVLISHHPEIIDYLASSQGRWFSREGNGPVRVSNQPAVKVEGLKLSETVARGWEQ